MELLTLNAGSSSIKYKVFEDENGLKEVLSGLIEGIGENQGFWQHKLSASQEAKPEEYVFENHQSAFAALAHRLKTELAGKSIEGVAHRVVHGGNLYYQPTLITKKVLKDIEDLADLAPLHNPVNALGIEFALKHFTTAKHVAIFDTGFHHAMPAYASTYAINQEVAQNLKIKRYGFHGINHEYVARRAAEYLQQSLEDLELISLHLGNGASACLIKEAKSFDTSMGMTPLPGLVMGTRCGDIDPSIILYLLKKGWEPAQIDRLLNKNSGLKGLAKDNDMRRLLEREQAKDPQAILCLEIFVYSIQKVIGAYLSQTPKLHGLIFTGGIGENASLIRERVLSPLKHLGFDLDLKLNQERSVESCRALQRQGPAIFVVKSDEERLMAEKLLILFQRLK